MGLSIEGGPDLLALRAGGGARDRRAVPTRGEGGSARFMALLLQCT